VLQGWLKPPVLETRLVNMAICPGMVAQLIKKLAPEGDNPQLGRERPRQSHAAISNPAALLLAKAHPAKAKAALRTVGLPVGRERALRAKDLGRREEGRRGNLAAEATNPALNGWRAEASYKILEVRLNQRSGVSHAMQGNTGFAWLNLVVAVLHELYTHRFVRQSFLYNAYRHQTPASALRLVRTREAANRSFQPIHHSGQKIVAYFLRCILRGVVVPITQGCGVRQHDTWIPLLPEGPMVGAPCARKIGGKC
jgi:hypothetical protein